MKIVLAMAAGTTLALGAACLAQPQGTKPAAQPSPTLPAPPAVDLTKQPTLYVVGYAHLDTQWRWTYLDTIRDFIPKTLRDNFALFDKYPKYVFNFSGSRRYRMMQEYYPTEYERLKRYVAAGRWFPCGSSVDENDANVPSGESIIRHVLYGNRFFREQFGVASEEYMLPDCFGFPAALPNVLAHCGIKGFSTQKLTWGLAIGKPPFPVGVWEGLDGHSVEAAFDPGAYVGEVKENLANSNGWQQRIKKTGDTFGTYVDYHYYGTGDQGGAPTEPSVAMVEQSVGTDGAIKVVSGPADWMFKAITPEERQKLPRYKGELMLTNHSAGSISSEAYMKRWNRKNELLADAAERASVAAAWMGGRPYPAQKLEDAWYLVLGSQMHDILPGTSVPKAYDFSWNDEVLAGNQFSAILSDAASSVISAMDTRGQGTAVVVYNPTSFEHQDVVQFAIPHPAQPVGVSVTGPDGKTVPAQLVDDGGPDTWVVFVASAPPTGFAAYDVVLTAPAAAASTLRLTERELENDAFLVKLDDNGDVASILDKKAKREVLSAPARLGLYYENPAQWPAWNQDWADRQQPAKSFAGGPVTFKITDRGPAKVAILVTRQAEGSTLRQSISLAAGDASGPGGRIDFDLSVDWRSRERSLRASFPLTASNPNATYDLQAGALERPNSHDKEFEYSFHKWLDLTDAKGDFGATVVCDSKYASDKPSDNTVRLTLLYTPGTRGGYPDQGTQDLGRHHITYALYPHAGDWRAARSFAQGETFNQPLIPFVASSHEGSLGKSFSLMHSSNPAVSISAAKKAEEGDEVIVRLREHSGVPAKGVHIALARPIVGAREVDGQERPISALAVKDGELVTDVGAFELRAFALKLGAAPAKVAAVTSTPVALAFDTDVISTNGNRADGAIDDQGNSLPAEQFPASLTGEGVTFNLGPTADGQKNAVSCRGQELSLPAGNFDRLYLLAAGTGDVQTSLQIDGKATPFLVQNWTGYIGQWDRRIWASEVTDGTPGNGDILGLEPGFVKPDSVAWYCSHHHTPKGDAIYEYSYVFKYGFDLPAGAMKVKLPDDPRIKVFAASVAHAGAARAVPVRPLFDTLSDHQADPPRITPGSGSFTDTTRVTIEPNLYGRSGALHYTLDGSQPTAQSPAYTGPITLSARATVKAALFGADGKPGPVASADLDVQDHTPPSVTRIGAAFRSPVLRVEFSEPVDASAVDGTHYTFMPALNVVRGTLSPDRRSALLTLSTPPETGKSYVVSIIGVRDASPAGNMMQVASTSFSVQGPVYTLEQVAPEQRGTPISVPGLPARAKDPWTVNVFVRAGKQPPNRTLIAGFGRLDNLGDGVGRYLAKFSGGIQFWTHNRDVPTRIPLSLNQWQMLTATYDGSTLRIYKDGQKLAERKVDLADDDRVVTLAPKDPWEHERQFDGELRLFTVWNQALDEDALGAMRSAASLP
jgi:alpha-mannosidase